MSEIIVDLPTPELAVVIERPTLLERVLFRRRETERFAVRCARDEWHWDCGGGRCPARVEAAIKQAVASREWARIWATHTRWI